MNMVLNDIEIYVLLLLKFVTGMKIFRQSYNFSEYLMTAHVPDRTTMVQGIEKLKNKLHKNFAYSMRYISSYYFY